MKLTYLLFVLIIIVSVSASLRHPQSLLKELVSGKVNTYSTGNSHCGNTTCTTTLDCPTFPHIYSECSNNICTFQPNADTQVCTVPSECGSSYSHCNCYDVYASTGCKCDNDYMCYDECYDGICVLSEGYIGEFCDSNTGDCEYGVCNNKTNQCEFVLEGSYCVNDNDCDLTLYCNASSCVERPLCNETMDDSIGYCPSSALCYQGTCYPQFSQTQGESCIMPRNCQPGLACINETDSASSTCQPVSLGTLCDDDDECAFLTQRCMCSEPDDSSPLVCSDNGFELCKQETIDVLACYVAENCFIYDIDDVSTDCHKKCSPLHQQWKCCLICRYPEYSDNAYLNVAGSCANNTMTNVNCCSENIPCAITTIEALCAGYSDK